MEHSVIKEHLRDIWVGLMQPLISAFKHSNSTFVSLTELVFTMNCFVCLKKQFYY